MLKNALVIMFDSLQFNYLGCYGNTWMKTPNMDRLAREGVLFENCYIEGLPTIPCRRAMHTGRYTLPVAGWVALKMEDTTIADLCWGRPIDTALIFDCPMYRLPKFGYTRGFDKVWFVHGHEGDDDFYRLDPLYHLKAEDYVDDLSHRAYTERYGEKVANAAALMETAKCLPFRQYWRTEKDRFVAVTIPKAIEYLEQVDRNKQFFLWIDSFDPHEGWDSPSVWDPDLKCPYDPDYQGKDEFVPFSGLVDGIYTEAQLNHIRMLYAELVTLCDKYLGTLMDTVRRLGFEQNTLFFMVSDHGEPMGNGEHGHGLMRKCRPWPYEELVHAPMILRGPGLPAGRRISAFVQSVDVAPTVCDWLGIGVHPAMQGKSLLPLVRDEVPKLRDFAISGYHAYSWAIYTEDWSYIHWVKGDSGDERMSMEFYGGGGTRKTTREDALAMIEFLEGKKKKEQSLLGSDVEAEYRENATVDGADQWTCTPASSSDVPAVDELYDRKKDPFQLNNVIAQHQGVAKELFTKLNAFMEDLQAS